MDGQSTQQMIAQGRKTLGMDSSYQFNVAVVGQSGVGKSTLINGMRTIRDNHTDAAAVGETETTSRIKKYPHPLNPQIVFWDVPGAGTLAHPDSTYFSDNMLYAFDCILGVISDRFLQVNFEIAKKAQQFNRPYAFVRAKSDLALKSLAERTGKKMQDASRDLRNRVDASLQKGLKDTGFSAETAFPLFIVSAWAFTRKNAYSLYKFRTKERDNTLEEMDEGKLLLFVTNLVTAREKERRN